jgi:hypothetical protein
MEKMPAKLLMIFTPLLILVLAGAFFAFKNNSQKPARIALLDRTKPEISLNLKTASSSKTLASASNESEHASSSADKTDGGLEIPEDEKINMLFFGDLMLDRHVKERIKKIKLDGLIGNLFKNLENYCCSNNFQDSCGETQNGVPGKKIDLISANLEGAATDKGAHYPPANGNDFAFDPETVGGLKKYGFNFFNIANNHLSDQGKDGIIENRRNLERLSFDFSGCADGEVGDCSLMVKLINGYRVGMAGFSMVYRPFDLKKAQAIVSNLASSTDLVVVNVHWGSEYVHQFSEKQKNVAHALADAGADLIIGHHPHVVQGIEIFKAVPILYSLGNFIFDQYFSADTQEGLAVGMNFQPGSGINITLLPLKSVKSQAELMKGAEKKKMLDKLAGWSVGDETKEMIRKGVIEIKE